jgi:N-acetylmuramoyl-L-alanine amidase-like protein
VRLHLVLEVFVEAFNDKGEYSGAAQLPAHARRVGGPITPRAVVVHTTDMLPNAWGALLRAWNQTIGGGACAHFLIGRDPKQGLTQMVSVLRNANHAGGNPHGWWVEEHREGIHVHPNTIAVGIEVHAAGRLEWLTKDRAVFQEDHKTLGEFSVSAGEVHVDDLGRPWHKLTEYQLETLEAVLLALKPVLHDIGTLQPLANAAYVKNRSKWDTSYAVATASSLVGHVTLDTINRSDPGSQGMTFINQFAQKDGWK